MKNSRSNYLTTGAAAQLLCPYKLAQKRPLKSILYLAVGLSVITFDVVFSNHILNYFNTNTLVFTALFAVSGFSVLRDIVSAKSSFSTSQPVVLFRLVSVATCLLLTAAALYASPFYTNYAAYIVLFCSAFRLFTPSKKHWYIPTLFGAIVLAAAIITVKIVYNGPNTAIGLDQVYPIITRAIKTIKDFIVSRW